MDGLEFRIKSAGKPRQKVKGRGEVMSWGRAIPEEPHHEAGLPWLLALGSSDPISSPAAAMLALGGCLGGVSMLLALSRDGVWWRSCCPYL